MALNSELVNSTILVVDDNEAKRYLVVSDLKDVGFKTIEASNGKEALSSAAKERPDLILLDIKLPDINGFQVLEKMRANSETSSIPVVFLSAHYPTDEAKVRGLEVGADGYLTHPVNPNMLYATIKSLLRIKLSERKTADYAAQLAEKNLELDRFATIAAHDLKAPLNSIMQFTELLSEKLEGQLDAESNEFMDFITSASKRMSSLVDKLLGYAKAGQQSLGPSTSTNLAVIMGNVRKNLKHAIDESGASIVSEGHPEIQGDELQLTRLFENLILNSIKYRKKNQSLQVRISAKESEVDRHFRVVDNGIGIEQKHLEKVFDIFTRVGLNQSDYEGSGIGLATCKKIVEAHGGKIWVESVFGEGTTVHFTICKPS